MTLPIGIPRGNSDSTREERKPEVTTVVPSLTRLPFSTKSSSSLLGLPTSGCTMPLAPSGTIWADTALEASVSSVTSAVPPVTLVTLPGQPAGRDHRLVHAHTVARALVDLHGRVPDGGRAGDHARR